MEIFPYGNVFLEISSLKKKLENNARRRKQRRRGEREREREKERWRSGGASKGKGVWRAFRDRRWDRHETTNPRIRRKAAKKIGENKLKLELCLRCLLEYRGNIKREDHGSRFLKPHHRFSFNKCCWTCSLFTLYLSISRALCFVITLQYFPQGEEEEY